MATNNILDLLFAFGVGAVGGFVCVGVPMLILGYICRSKR